MRKKYQTASCNYTMLEEFAKANRNNPTEAERVLWGYLKGGIMGVHFRQQHILLDYIPDFVCLSKRIIIEIDGGYHFEGEQPERDMERTEELKKQGFSILRFTNEEVLGNIDHVIETISTKLENISDTEKPNYMSKTNNISNHLPSLGEGSGLGLTIIKVGGAVVEDEAQLTQLLRDFTAIQGAKILVHGGGRRATKIAERLGIETKMIDGRRITDAEMLEVVTMVYGGLVNKNVVARLQALGCDAIGLTGADANILLSTKRPPIPSGGAGGGLIDFGFVGDVKLANGTKITHFIEAGLTPVIAPLTHDGKGNMLNTNADTMASETAKAMAAAGYDVTLIYAFEKPGVLRDAEDDNSVIEKINHADFEAYKADGTISGGMLPKIENALAAVDAGVKRVIITKATAIDGQHGTIIMQ